MHHGEFVGQGKQAFRVAHEQVALEIETARELFQQALLFGFVKIHHDVAAEDHIIALRQVFCFQIMKVEMDDLFQRLLDGIAVAGLVEVAQAVAVVHARHLGF